jgi:PAS domain S-box-containing protein
MKWNSRTTHERAEYALRKSEAKLAGILAIAGDAIVSINAMHRISLYNEAAERMFGYSPAEVLGQPIDVLIPTRFHRAHKHHIERFASGPDIARRMGERQEVVARRKNGDEFPTEASISKLDVNGDRFYTVVLRDITERKELEENKNLLIGELDHRVKNVLSKVLVIVSHTQDTSSSMADFVIALDGRIKSLARTHELLSERSWKGLRLAELVHRELAPYGTASNTQIEGSDDILTAEAGQAFAMVLHELATNAAKYGALSRKDGHVSVRWSHVRSGCAENLLYIHWEENGGPIVMPPARTGYGTSVIRDLIPYELGGTVDLVYARDGVRCKVEIPTHWLIGRSQSGELKPPEPRLMPKCS